MHRTAHLLSAHWQCRERHLDFDFAARRMASLLQSNVWYYHHVHQSNMQSRFVSTLGSCDAGPRAPSLVRAEGARTAGPVTSLGVARLVLSLDMACAAQTTKSGCAECCEPRVAKAFKKPKSSIYCRKGACCVPLPWSGHGWNPGDLLLGGERGEEVFLSRPVLWFPEPGE